MANEKDLNHKISSLQNMQKVMRAMNMISSIKLQKIFRKQEPLQIFDESVNAMEYDITKAFSQFEHPLVNGYPATNKAHVILFTADKGLCGSHNSMVQKALAVLAAEYKKKDVSIDVTCIGIKGMNYCKRKDYTIYHSTESSDKTLNKKAIEHICSDVFNRFLSQDIQQVFMIYNRFVSVLQQDTITAQLLPLPQAAEEKKQKTVLNASFEPNPEEFISRAAELYLFYKFQVAITNSYLSEHASRMTAMENATNNSEDLINRYETLQNRARQTSITNELIEIISGKESLKG
jgi:F-type H+-transporting ATPase subunit gamma